MDAKFKLLIPIFITFFSCSPYTIILNNSILPSIYFKSKIKRLDKEEPSFQKNRDLIKTKIEYSYGVILEQNDRIIEDDYFSAVQNNKKAYRIFKEVEQLCLINLNYFESKLDNRMELIKETLFDKEDVFELYYLAASLGGAIKTSQGDPKELINLPKIGKLLKTAIIIDSKWNNGALQSAMMSYMASRMDIARAVMKDSVDFYFEKACDYSNNLDASVFVSYAELIHKPGQNKTDFIKTLEKALSINTKKNSYLKLSNLIAQKRARWLLSNIEDYFI